MLGLTEFKNRDGQYTYQPNEAKCNNLIYLFISYKLFELIIGRQNAYIESKNIAPRGPDIVVGTLKLVFRVDLCSANKHRRENRNGRRKIAVPFCCTQPAAGG